MIRTLFRYFLAFIYLYAGASKVTEPMLFRAVIQNYFAINDTIAIIAVILVPWIQILAALSLIINWQTIYSSGLLLGMSAFFFILMVVNYGETLPFGCGCFGFSGEEIVSYHHVTRDFLITALSGVVFYNNIAKKPFH